MAENQEATVLAVDDDPDVLSLVEAVLQRFGFRVLTASSAAEAVSVFESVEQTPDLLLTDVVMPGVSGPVLAEQLLQQKPSMRVLFMSGYDDRQVVQHYVVNQGFPLLPKPFTYENLASKVRETLQAPPASMHGGASI